MSMKLKVLGLGLLALMATSAFAVMNASANGGGGHFVSDGASPTSIVGTEAPGTGVHEVHFTPHASPNERIGCDKVSYTGTVTGNTASSVTITPKYEICQTTDGGAKDSVKVTVNGCTYTFTVTPGTTDATEQEVHLLCPQGKAIEIHHPNCTITITPQTVKNAVTYTHKNENGKNYITMDINATFATEYHGGICIFLGTNQLGKLTGSVTVKGFSGPNQVNITAT